MSVKKFALISFIVLCSFAMADLSGNWKGRVVMEGGRAEGAMLKTPTMKLTLQSDGTYSIVQTTPEKKQTKSNGTWKESGNKVILIALLIEGKRPTKDQAIPREYIFSADKKSMKRDVSKMVKTQFSPAGSGPGAGDKMAEHFKGAKIFTVYTKE